MTSSTLYDLAIIGAGPAGMAGARSASALGLRVALLDEKNSLGGQIYRQLSQPVLKDRHILGPDYYDGHTLIQQAQQANVDYFPNANVWEVSFIDQEQPNQAVKIHFSVQQTGQQIQAKKLLIATGAQERPTPFPGWTLPGVMTCGAAQILLKASGLTPALPLVITGSGPLLLLIAAQLHRAGIQIAAILDTTPKGRTFTALPHLGQALRNMPLLLKGVSLVAELKKAKIPFYKEVTGLGAIAGRNDRLDKVSFTSANSQHEIPCHSLLTHQGVVPNVQLSRSLQLEHTWHQAQACWHPKCDSWGKSSHNAIYIAGDTSGIAGAKAAAYSGELAALKIAQTLSFIEQKDLLNLAKKPRLSLDKEKAIRPFLDALYYPENAFLSPSDDTLVCRCEEVSAKTLRHLVKQGCNGPNQTKAFSRAGMGPCQGRQCGLTVSQIIAQENGVTPDEVGYYQVRPPIKPIRLNELIPLAEYE